MDSDQFERLGPKVRELTPAQKAECPPEWHWFAELDIHSCDICCESEVWDIITYGVPNLRPMYRDKADDLVVCQACVDSGAWQKDADPPLVVAAGTNDGED